MRKTLKGLSALLLVIAIIASLFTFSTSAASSEPTKYSKEYNSGQRDIVCTTLSGTSAGSYYSGSYSYDSLSNLSASTLKSSLTTLMKSTHKYTSSYDDCRDMAVNTDCENENGKSNKLLLIYTSYTATRSQYNGWNREHVWPKSLGGNNTSGGGADLHHIRPSDAGVNSSRGNKKYGEAGAGATAKYGSNPATGYLGGTYNSTYFEPNDNVKGDVARICLYVLVRWGSAWGADSITEVFQSVDVLLEWCEMDPVDTWEMGRNEVVQEIQGNRNVFIDYPEYAWLIFGREVPDDMTTPSGMAKSQQGGSGNQGGTENEGGNAGGNVGGSENEGGSGNQGGTENEGGSSSGNQGGSESGTVECKHPNLVITGQVTSCVDMGYTGDKSCPDCDYCEEGEFTFPEGHKVGTVISENEGKKFYICSECGEGITEGGETNDGGNKNGIIIAVSVTGGVLILGGGAAGAFIFIKKKKKKAAV